MRILALLLLLAGSIAYGQEDEYPTSGTFYRSDNCFEMVLSWPAEDMITDGHEWIQFRYVHQETDEIIYAGGAPGVSYRIADESVPLGQCGFGLWSYELRLSLPDPANPMLLVWDPWDSYKLVYIALLIRPEPPSLLARLQRLVDFSW